MTREFGLIGCAWDEDIIWLGGVVGDKDLVGVEVGEDIVGVGVEVGENLVGVVVGFGFEGF